jgi:hypothetical protein
MFPNFRPSQNGAAEGFNFRMSRARQRREFILDRKLGSHAAQGFSSKSVSLIVEEVLLPGIGHKAGRTNHAHTQKGLW